MGVKQTIGAQFSRINSNVWVQHARLEFAAFINSVKASFNHRMLDASQDFWAYHLGGISAFLVLDIVLKLLFRPSYMWGFNLLSIMIWAAGFSVSCLLFRQHYKRANWESQPQFAILIKSIGCAIFFAVPVVALLLLPVAVYHEELIRFYQYRVPGMSSAGALTDFVLGNIFTTAFYLVCWMILYMGITSRRRAKQIEVANLRLQNSLREAELSSLSNQLNPHFLFNALNNIRFMIQEDARNAEEMLMSLSSVLRYSLDSSKQDKVLLEQELEISQRYIDLVQIQFEERLQFSSSVEPNLGNCKVPPMVLQMLLENAVKHGIENIQVGGKIQVSVTLEDNLLKLTVCNDLPSDYQHGDNEPGIGLFNIEQRLELLYGDAAEIDAGVDEGRYCVKLVIPQEECAE